MSLNSALQIGRSALLTHQTAIEVTGNNLANAATRGYHRQTIGLQPVRGQEVLTGVFVGRGVQVESILRQVNDALEGRIRGSIADQSGSAVSSDVLSQIEALQNELSDTDLSSQLSAFFNSLSELANRPQDNSLRSLVVQQGKTLASQVRTMRGGLTDIRTQLDGNIDQAVASVNDLLQQIERVNGQITQNQAIGGGNSLRDQRDALLGELAQYMDISVIELPSGAADVFVGSLPIVLNGHSRGVSVRKETIDGELQISIRITADGSELIPRSGTLGALIAARRETVGGAIDTLDGFANSLIYEINKVHSQGQGLSGFASVTGTSRVADVNVALNNNAAGLAFTPTHGGFQVHLTQKSTGQRQTTAIDVDLDGLGTDTTLTSLAASLNAVGNLNASITADGRLVIAADTGDYEVSFSDDSSGALAALGINSFFSGGNARDIAVNSVIDANPGLIAAARGHLVGDNSNALALQGLRDGGIPALGNQSLSEVWSRHVEDIAIRLGQATTKAQADGIVRENLEAQQQSVSGVNTDEEAINLLSYQRAYQASARFLNVVDEMMQTLLNLI